MRKRVFASLFAIALVGSAISPLLATGAVDAAKADKVVICHSTRSAKNPYVFINVSGNAAAAHAAHHDGDDIVGECG